MSDVHIEGTERIAEAVAKYDVDRFIHVSSHNADPKSPSEFFATKAYFLTRTVTQQPCANHVDRDEASKSSEVSSRRQRS